MFLIEVATVINNLILVNCHYQFDAIDNFAKLVVFIHFSWNFLGNKTLDFNTCIIKVECQILVLSV